MLHRAHRITPPACLIHSAADYVAALICTGKRHPPCLRSCPGTLHSGQRRHQPPALTSQPTARLTRPPRAGARYCERTRAY